MERQYLDYEGLEQLNKHLQIQFTSLPEPSLANLNKIVQYIGASTVDYTNGSFYKCVSDGAASPTFSWKPFDDAECVISGYYNTLNGKFYNESTFVTEIPGDVNAIFIDLFTNVLYRYNEVGHNYIALTAGASPEIVDVFELPSTTNIENKIYEVSNWQTTSIVVSDANIASLTFLDDLSETYTYPYYEVNSAYLAKFTSDSGLDYSSFMAFDHIAKVSNQWFVYDLSGTSYELTDGNTIYFISSLQSDRHYYLGDNTKHALCNLNPTLGTAAAKNVAASGDASTTEVVMGNDSRLTNDRNAADVSAWAKAETKPTYTAVEVGAIASTEKGTASGVAELDVNGKVPSSQLPSFVDEVKEGYLNTTDGKFYKESTYITEITAEADKIYVDKSTNITYRWSGSDYVPIGSDLALGETSSTAYRGDRGKAAYDHATDANKISSATASGLYKVGTTAEGHVSSLTAVTKDDILALGISEGDSVDLPMGPLFSRTQPTAWKEKDWGVEFTIYGNNIWSDGENIYYSIADENNPINYVLDRSTGTWEEKDWSEGALTSFNGMNVWTDGTNVYYSSVDEEVGNFVLNKSTGLWEDKTWGEFNNALEGYAMWTDGKFVYCSREGHYTLYLENGAWHDITWTVEDVSVSFNPAGYKIWTDGNNIYFSDTDYYTLNLVLVKDSSSSAPSLTWKQKTWNGLTQFDGQWVWADGTNIYYADPNANPQIHYVLDTATSTWIEKDWNMAIGLFYPSDVWSDGNNIYYSSFDDSFERSVSYVLTGNISADNTNLNLGTAAAKDSTSTITSGSTDLIEGGAVYTALQGKANSADLGTAASKDSTSTIAQGSTDLPEAGAVYNAMNDLENYLPQSYSNNWSRMSWKGLTELQGKCIWTDGNNIYYSSNIVTQYVLDKSTSTWNEKTWSGFRDINGEFIWSDGDNIYYSNSPDHYVLDKSTSTWTKKTWNGSTNIIGQYIWTDGDNIYCSYNSNHYVLDKSTSTWSAKAWSGLTSFDGDCVWTDGGNIYYSNSSNQYVLDKSTSTWTQKTWSGLTSFYGNRIWTDGDNIYYSSGSTQYVLNKSTSTWETKTWSGLTSFYGIDVWSDGEKIYYSSYDSYQNFVLGETTARCGNAAKKNVTTSVTSGSADVVTSGAVYTYVDTVITQALTGSY